MNIGGGFGGLITLGVCGWSMKSVNICVSSSGAKREKWFVKMKILLSFYEGEEVAWPGYFKRLVESDMTDCQSCSLSEKFDGELSPVWFYMMFVFLMLVAFFFYYNIVDCKIWTCELTISRIYNDVDKVTKKIGIVNGLGR